MFYLILIIQKNIKSEISERFSFTGCQYAKNISIANKIIYLLILIIFISELYGEKIIIK